MFCNKGATQRCRYTRRIRHNAAHFFLPLTEQIPERHDNAGDNQEEAARRPPPPPTSSTFAMPALHPPVKRNYFTFSLNSNL